MYLWVTSGATKQVDCVRNIMAHAQKPDFIFRRNGRVHLNRWGRQFSRLLAAEVCTSAVVMLDTPCSEVVWRVLATHSIRQFLHFPPVRHRVPSYFNWTLPASYPLPLFYLFLFPLPHPPCFSFPELVSMSLLGPSIVLSNCSYISCKERYKSTVLFLYGLRGRCIQCSILQRCVVYCSVLLILNFNKRIYNYTANNRNTKRSLHHSTYNTIHGLVCLVWGETQLFI